MFNIINICFTYLNVKIYHPFQFIKNKVIFYPVRKLVTGITVYHSITTLLYLTHSLYHPFFFTYYNTVKVQKKNNKTKRQTFYNTFVQFIRSLIFTRDAIWQGVSLLIAPRILSVLRSK